MLFGKKKKKLEEWKSADHNRPINDVSNESVNRAISMSDKSDIPQPIAQNNVENNNPGQNIQQSTPQQYTNEQTNNIEPKLNQPEVEKKQPEVADKSPIRISNPTIDTFTILANYHKEIASVVTKYDNILNSLLTLANVEDEKSKK